MATVRNIELTEAEQSSKNHYENYELEMLLPAHLGKGAVLLANVMVETETPAGRFFYVPVKLSSAPNIVRDEGKVSQRQVVRFCAMDGLEPTRREYAILIDIDGYVADAQGLCVKDSPVETGFFVDGKYIPHYMIARWADIPASI